jgi:uncharacterized membrane protein YfcA
LLSDLIQFSPSFFAVAIPAVFIVGLSKGGFGGGLAMLGTPLLALVISPVQAAAILLPVLLLMDAISLYNYRGIVNWDILKIMIPAAIGGIGLGWMTANMVSDDWIRIIVGTISLVFAVNQITKELLKRSSNDHNALAASFWGCFAGFTSFIAHAGAPPYQAYTVPLKMEKLLFTGTSVVFFASINALKVIPYFFLGQFSAQNLNTSLTLLPIAIIGVLTGVALVKKISQNLFYKATYLFMLVIGLKLIWDGRAALLAFA